MFNSKRLNNYFAYVAPGSCNLPGVYAHVANNSQKERKTHTLLGL